MTRDPAGSPPTEPTPTTHGGAPVRLLQLKVVFAPRAPAIRALRLEQPVVIGRSPGPTGLTLDDPQVSQQHAAVEPEGDGWIIRDLDSRNGVFVDGVRVQRAPLEAPATIRVGGSLLLFLDSEVPAGARLEPETETLRGQSVAMQLVRGAIAQVGPHDLPVLILGETGVGKELVARALHDASRRRGAFVAVNCAAIPHGVAESELFGHVAGAFTGAGPRTEGLFAAAEGGTLFLDEIGELAPALQPKLLRALATREIRPVGGSTARRIDVRIVAATLRLKISEPDADGFRSDLYARLASWTITVPPLRHRPDDTLRLAQVFLERDGRSLELTARTAEALLLHDWPRNVRELEQALAAAAIRAGDERRILPTHLPEAVLDGLPSRPAPDATPPPIELTVPRDQVPSAEELRLVLERFGGNVAKVAAFFGKARPQVYRWLDRHGIDIEAFRKD